MAAKIWIDNTNNIELLGLYSESEGVYINDAIVSVTLKVGTAAGADVAGQGWPLLLAYVQGSDGNYRAPLTYALALTQGAKYTAILDAEASSTNYERHGHWELPITAAVRTTT